MKLEDKITREETTYIHSMDYNWKERRFTLNLVKNPGIINGAGKRVTFSNVSNFLIDEETNKSVDQIMGISEHRENDGVKYIFLTEQRTFMFLTDKEPLLLDLP